MTRLLITDLDNTLYDWVTYYARSFDRMVDALVELLGVDRPHILSEFKEIHQSYGNSEQPFASLELPSVTKAFPKADRQELARRLAGPFGVFAEARKQSLRLYDGVAETLRDLDDD